MEHVNYNASCRDCCHRDYCYAYTGWSERAQTCIAYNQREAKYIVMK